MNWPHLGLLFALPAFLIGVARGQWPAEMALVAWFALNAAVLALGERLLPFRPDWNAEPRHLRRDGAVLAMNLPTDAAIGAALTALAIAYLPGGNDWPFAVQLLAGMLAAEFGSYWLHRWSHRDNWLWRVHLLHHRPDRLNLANAVLAHPINTAYDKLLRLAPLLLLGLRPEVVLAIGLFSLTQSLAVHANIAGGLGWLDRLVGSAELHRLHHSTDEREAGNFGTALPFWDLLFGTYRRGRAPRAVGVFEPARYPGEFELGRLLRLPCC